VVERWGGVDDGENYARFKSVPQGCAALADLLASAYKDFTVAQMISKYAPSGDKNDPGNYIKVVCGWARINPGDSIRNFEPGNIFDLLKAITRFEGWD
jgi:hypothetical protein